MAAKYLPCCKVCRYIEAKESLMKDGPWRFFCGHDDQDHIVEHCKTAAKPAGMICRGSGWKGRTIDMLTSPKFCPLRSCIVQVAETGVPAYDCTACLYEACEYRQAELIDPYKVPGSHKSGGGGFSCEGCVRFACKYRGLPRSVKCPDYDDEIAMV